MCSVLIVYNSEAQDWASYLKVILEASHHFPQDSISFYLVDGEDSVQDEDYTIFNTSQCILLLLSVAFIDIQSEPGVRNTLKKFLYPPSKIVAFMCGVSENEGIMDCFDNWESWRKLDTEDEPALYVSTIRKVIEEENIVNLEEENYIPSPEETMDQPAPEEPPQIDLDQLPPPVDDVEDLDSGNLPQFKSLSVSDEQIACLIVQPNRIRCGTPVDVYIIMINKLDIEGSIEVEFQCEHSTKRVPGTAVNEYTVTLQSPDMPSGEIAVHLYNNESIVCSTTVAYYTEMEEISHYLEKVMDPMHFMCQAFSITSNSSEELDSLFTDSLKKQMPPNGLKIFGVSQLQEEITNQQDVELPTLLHFSAKYGLKKLTSSLLQCPGALQAYSIANKNGYYPNTLAERSGFPDLRQFMDDYVETIDLVKTHIEESNLDCEGDEDIYETMANASQNFVAKFSLQEDIYESMMQLNPDMQLYEDLESLDSSFNESHSEDAVLRKFFAANAKKHSLTEEDFGNDPYSARRVDDTEEESVEYNEENYAEDDEEDPYKLCYPDEIYDTIDQEEGFAPVIMNRPPAPVPRACTSSEPEECKTYISTVFSSKNSLYAEGSCKENESPQVRPVPERMLSSTHDPYAGMKTPGQRQLISLQERVKVGALTVEEAVQEFKAWQFDQEKRSQSVRFQQDNLQKLRDSIIRRKKDKGKGGKEIDLDITAPMQRNLRWGSHMNVECSVYEPAPRSVTQPPSVNRLPQRGTWHTGSTSSTCSSGSNRLSTLSTISNSSGAEGELEEPQENCPPPPRPPRPAAEAPPTLPPPRVPPRLPERFPDSMLHERYVSNPARHISNVPPHRGIPPPPVTRRPR